MEINGVTNQTPINTQNNKNILDKNAFLKILSVQLSNQDPLNAQDNTEYVAQMAQFSSLEQTQNLNTSIEKLLTSEQMNQGTLLINKNVQIALDDGSITNEIVKGVRVEKNNVYLMTENGKYSIDSVVQVGDE